MLRLGKVAVDGAHYDHAGVEAGVLVEQVQLPVDEGAQEIPLAKLDHAVRILGPGKASRFRRCILLWSSWGCALWRIWMMGAV